MNTGPDGPTNRLSIRHLSLTAPQTNNHNKTTSMFMIITWDICVEMSGGAAPGHGGCGGLTLHP